MDQIVSPSLSFNPPVPRPEAARNAACRRCPVCRRGQKFLRDPGIVPPKEMVQKIAEGPFIQELRPGTLVVAERSKTEGAYISKRRAG